jgi:hypothetical protein
MDWNFMLLKVMDLLEGPGDENSHFGSLEGGRSALFIDSVFLSAVFSSTGDDPR